eukprot:3783302-Rhodomonas_salina.1
MAATPATTSKTSEGSPLKPQTLTTTEEVETLQPFPDFFNNSYVHQQYTVAELACPSRVTRRCWYEYACERDSTSA